MVVGLSRIKALLLKASKPEHQHLIPDDPKDFAYQNKCIVVLFGANKGHRTLADGSVERFKGEKTYMPFIVGDLDDLKHIEIVRRTKGYGVSGVELLGNIRNPQVREAIANEIHLLTHAPEVAESMKQKDEQIAALMARLEALQEKKAEEQVQVLVEAAEARAGAGSRPKRSGAPDQ